MAITKGSLIPVGARVRIRRAGMPIDPAVVGRTGVVVDATPYRARSYGVAIDGERALRMFAPAELEAIEKRELSPARERAKARRALP